MRKLGLGIVLCGCMISSGIVAATECSMYILQNRTGDAAGIGYLDVQDMYLDFCVGAITCDAFRGTPQYEVVSGYERFCEQKDAGYVYCNWKPTVQSIRVGYEQTGDQIRITVMDYGTRAEIVRGTAIQEATITDKDYKTTINTTDKCPE